jgi:hypothetical protein
LALACATTGNLGLFGEADGYLLEETAVTKWSFHFSFGGTEFAVTYISAHGDFLVATFKRLRLPLATIASSQDPALCYAALNDADVHVTAVATEWRRH